MPHDTFTLQIFDSGISIPATHAGSHLAGGTDPLPIATTASAGLMSAAQAIQLGDNNAKVSNVTHTGDVTGSDALTISTGAVTQAKIQDGAVTGPKLAADSVSATKIVNGSVSFAKFQDVGGLTVLGRSASSSGPPSALSCSALGFSLIAGVDAPAMRSILGVGTLATQDSVSINLATDAGSSILSVTNGGTGRATGVTPNSLLATGSSATGVQQTLPSGAIDQVLVGGGETALPTWATATGTGAPVLATSPTLDTPTLDTPVLGTPLSGTLTNCTGLPIAAGTTGTLPASRLPLPTTTEVGGVKRNTGTAGQFVNGIDSLGGLVFGAPPVGVSTVTVGSGGLTGLTGSFTTGSNPALSLALLPPTTTTLGGVKRNVGTAGQFVSGVDPTGDLIFGAPPVGVSTVTVGSGGLTGLTGSFTTGSNPALSLALAAPTTTTLGGVKRNTGTAGQFVNGIDSTGGLIFDAPPVSVSTVTVGSGGLTGLTGSFTTGSNPALSLALLPPTTTTLGGVKRNIGTAGQIVSGISSDGSLIFVDAPTGGEGTGDGTVTSFTFTEANGFVGTVGTATTTPTLSLKVSPVGILKGSATGTLVAAVSGTDFAPATGSTAYAPISGSTNYAPISGSTNYAPATGSTAYAPISGSTNYAPAVGSTSITTLGTIATGVWSGTAIVVAKGGTGATDAATARTNLGVPSLTGTGASGTWSVSITGNAATATNGVVTTSSYANPSWITSLATSKLTGTVAITQGGTGATDAATARTNLSVPSLTGTGASGTWGVSVTGNAATATTLATARTIALSGDVSGSASFNGSTNATITGTVVSASATVAGKVELATQAEVDAGTDTVRAVTPATVASRYLKKTGDSMTGALAVLNVTLSRNDNASEGGQIDFNRPFDNTAAWSIDQFGPSSTDGGALRFIERTGTVSTALSLSKTAATFSVPVTANSFIGDVTGNVSGNAATVTNGVVTTSSYANPSWITSLATSKLTGSVAVANGGTGATDAATARTNLSVPSLTGTGASGTWGVSVTGNAATVTNGVVTTSSYANPSWITSLATSKLTGTVAITQGGTGATTGSGAVTNLTTVEARSGTAITLTSADSGKILRTTEASAITVTIPTGLAANFSVMIIQGGAGAITFSGGSTIQSFGGLVKTAGIHAAANIIRVGVDTYNLSGNLI
jgi:hypothetical protein